MNDAMRHRGPDADGVWQHGPCALGHRRLSIIDLSADARQPMCNEDGSVALVANGEIYNFLELRRELLAKGHLFRSRSDSEVILHLYEEHGPDCVRRLSGMFAFALFDARENRLLLARDRAGKKPLFYRHLKHGLAFASEVHALLTGFPEDAPEVDYGAIDEFLTLQYVPSPRSAYVGIAKLPAAHYALLAPGGAARIERYWRKPAAGAPAASARELADELSSLLGSAVRRRLVADVPLGAFLSGGVDSSMIVALMATQSTARVKTFSIGFPHADDSELEYARLVAARYDTDHHEMIVDPAMTDVIDPIVRHHGEPFADSSAIAMYYLARMTKEHVTVALSGDAADEVFAGYKRYRTARLGHVYDALPPVARSVYRAALIGALHFPGAIRRRATPWRFRAAKRRGTRRSSAISRPKTRRSSTCRACRPPTRAPRSSASSGCWARALPDPRSAVSPTSIFRRICTDDINVKVDIASMAHSLEVRCPYLDTEVVEFAARLPANMLMRVRGKYLLRRAAAGLVPKPILRRRKRGFAPAAEALAAPRSAADDARRAARSHRARARAVRSGLRCEARRLAGPRVRSGGPDLDAASCSSSGFARSSTRRARLRKAWPRAAPRV